MGGSGNSNLDRMEQGNLAGLLCSFCIPSLASSLVTSVYNIVDQLFIGQVLGIVGNAAANVVFPLMTLLTALSLMCGVGASAHMNLYLGRGQKTEAGRVAGNGLVLMVLCGLVPAMILESATQPVLRLFGCTETVMPYAASYGRIIALGFVFSMVGAAGPFLLRADGRPMYALFCIAAGAVLNIFLDGLFVAAFGWGIQGAAWATVISQAVSAGLVVAYLPRFRAVRLEWSMLVPDPALCREIIALGAGPAFNFMTQALTQVFLNNALRTYGAASVYGSEITLAAAGVANKVNTFAVAVVTGLTNGMQPIVSYNFGRKNYKRVADTGKAVIGTVLAAGMVVCACYQCFPAAITALFGEGSELYYEFAAKFFRIYLMLIGLFGLQSSVAGFFSAQGKPGKSILISLTRQVIFLTPLLIILPKFFGLDGVLWAGPAADLAMAVLALTLLGREFGHLKALERENQLQM